MFWTIGDAKEWNSPSRLIMSTVTTDLKDNVLSKRHGGVLVLLLWSFCCLPVRWADNTSLIGVLGFLVAFVMYHGLRYFSVDRRNLAVDDYNVYNSPLQVPTKFWHGNRVWTGLYRLPLACFLLLVCHCARCKPG